MMALFYNLIEEWINTSEAFTKLSDSGTVFFFCVCFLDLPHNREKHM